MVAKVTRITEYGYFGPSQNVRDVRAAPSLESMITCIYSLPTPAEREASRAAGKATRSGEAKEQPVPTCDHAADDSVPSGAQQQRPVQPEPPSFEERLAAVAAGKAQIVPAFKPSRVDPDRTLGGVSSGML